MLKRGALLAALLLACFVGVSTAAAGNDECPADVEEDGVVDVHDLLEVLEEWGEDDDDADVNGDGIVDVLDLLAVLAAWGDCP